MRMLLVCLIAAVLLAACTSARQEGVIMPPQVHDELWQPFDRLTGEWWAVAGTEGAYPSAGDLERLQAALRACERAIERHQSAARSARR